ncbi:unnamed protein product [Tilletia controversa]|nr:unnamed protein product [Tilletia controversa]
MQNGVAPAFFWPLAIAAVHRSDEGKLRARGVRGMFTGYDQQHKACQQTAGAPGAHELTELDWSDVSGVSPVDDAVYVTNELASSSQQHGSAHIEDDVVQARAFPEVERDIDGANFSMTAIKAFINKAFKCTDSGPVTHFLGMKIDHDPIKGKVVFSQAAYIDAMLERFGVTKIANAASPLPPLIPSRTPKDTAAQVDRAPQHNARRGTTAPSGFSRLRGGRVVI